MRLCGKKEEKTGEKKEEKKGEWSWEEDRLEGAVSEGVRGGIRVWNVQNALYAYMQISMNK